MTENLTEFIKGRENIITNLDPDGLFSYALLKKVFDCKLVGFTNSKEYVYLFNGMEHSNNKVTYVDMFVNNKEIHSIDQHIVCYTEKENETLQSFGTKLNPNVWHKRSFENYKIKYPFSTFIYLGTLLDREGYDLNIDWHRPITETLELGHVLLRVDGVLTNLVDYSVNCKNWLEWSKEFSNGGSFIKGLCNFLEESINVLDIKEKAKEVEDFFKQHFRSETKDGGYKSIVWDNLGHIANFSRFTNFVFDNVSDNIFENVSEIEIYKGDKLLTTKPNDGILNSDVFSYAIVNMKENNLSLTKNIKKDGILLI